MEIDLIRVMGMGRFGMKLDGIEEFRIEQKEEGRKGKGRTEVRIEKVNRKVREREGKKME